MEDLSLRVRHKGAGMQIRETQCWFVLFLIKHTRLGDRSDVCMFFSHHLIQLGKIGKFVGMSLLVTSPSSTKQLNEIKQFTHNLCFVVYSSSE